MKADVGLSEAERRVLAMTAEVWNLWCRLPSQDDDDNADFHAAIHAIQRLIALRVARQIDPDVWRR